MLQGVNFDNTWPKTIELGLLLKVKHQLAMQEFGLSFGQLGLME